ncbi:MAG: UvrD-helicase domain-containing protein [Planctomycetes bacterium]|nr:UvrD-helicase domain-containing protein [Planctomycetota bacterium]
MSVDRADALRSALLTLAARCRDDGLAEAARTSALDYDRLLMAATELCRHAPPELAERFDVLMVDELQDTNPAQLAFYVAFAELRRHLRQAAPLTTFFVGDGRQSILSLPRRGPVRVDRVVDARAARWRARRDRQELALDAGARSAAAGGGGAPRESGERGFDPPRRARARRRGAGSPWGGAVARSRSSWSTPDEPDADASRSRPSRSAFRAMGVAPGGGRGGSRAHLGRC